MILGLLFEYFLHILILFEQSSFIVPRLVYEFLPKSSNLLVKFDLQFVD